VRACANRGYTNKGIINQPRRDRKRAISRFILCVLSLVLEASWFTI